MGQNVSVINLQLVNCLKSQNSIPNPVDVVSTIGSEDVRLFLSSQNPIKVINDECQTSKSWMKLIQNYLHYQTNMPDFESIENQLDTLFLSVNEDYKKTIQETNDNIERYEKLKISFFNTFKDHDNNQQQASSESKFSNFIKSAEKHLTKVTSHLNNKSKVDSSASNDRMTDRQLANSLHKFLSPNASLKEVLSTLHHLLHDTNTNFDVRNILLKFNDRFVSVRPQWEREQLKDHNKASKQTLDGKILTHLSSVGAFPNSRLKNILSKHLTGQFISLFVFTHIHFHSTINTKKNFDSGSVQNSMSFELHADTFKQLFDIIKQLSTIPSKHLSPNLTYILIICLRLFSNHLKFLFSITKNSLDDSLSRRNDQNQTTQANQDISLDNFDISNDDLQAWFETLFELSCRENEKSEQIIISSLASKCCVQIFNKKIPLFTEKLEFIYQYMVENKHYFLIKELLIDLNTNEQLFNWIETLSNNKSENTIAYNLLYLLLNIYFKSSDDFKPKLQQLIQEIIQRLQKFVFMGLSSTYDFANQYISYILKNFSGRLEVINDLLNPILIGLGLMKEKYFNFTTIQTITTNILPLLSDFALKNSADQMNTYNNQHYIYWLLGKMTNTMIIGSHNNALEEKYTENLQSLLFLGGCEKLTAENNKYTSNLFESNLAEYISLNKFDYNFDQSSSDEEFLISVYNNIDQGARLISKMKLFTKDKQYVAQKSIEQQANHSCAALFAVYLKFYRRINLAKYELNQKTDKEKPHRKLLSIFEHASHVYLLFARTKGQGGNVDELYEQIKKNTLFLLTSIKQSNFIPVIDCEVNEQFNKLRSQYARRPDKKNDFRLIRNVFQVCKIFKKSALKTKKVNEEKEKNEFTLRRTIENFVFNEKNFHSNDFIECMTRQYERALIRLITYKFSYKFIEKILNTGNLMYLRIYLFYLRKNSIDWSYLENISSTNIQLKEDISKTYYDIIKQTFSHIDRTLLIQNVFYLLNLSYGLTDIYNIYNDKFLESLYNTYMNSTIDIKSIIYNWFRLYIINFCENSQLESMSTLINDIQEWIFNNVILHELKLFTENTCTNEKSSFNNITIEWFIKAKNVKNVSSKFEYDLYINQYLMIVLRCVHYYSHIQSYCANEKFIEQLIYISQKSNNHITCLLSLKILRKLIAFFPEDVHGKSKLIMNKFLKDILYSIGKKIPDITTEMINIYRTLMFFESPWQLMTIQFIFDTLISNFQTLQSMDHILASLSILGGYIQPFCLGSIVEIQDADEFQLGVIIEINQDGLNSDKNETFPYLVQVIQTNKTQWIKGNKLKIVLDVLPPNLLDLPNINEYINTLFDVLISFLQNDSSLELKRRSICVLYRILNYKELVDIFIQKPYLSIIANLLKIHRSQSTNLHLLNKQQLEQYSLSLDRCKYFKPNVSEIKKTSDEDFIIWTTMPFQTNLPNNDLFSSTEWKPSMSKRELDSFKNGRVGNDECKIIELSSQLADKWFMEESGIIHRFPGRVLLVSENSNTLFATFIVENLQLTEGNWYFCVRLLESTCARIGWLTNGFKPGESIGIGQDQYSWSYDGSEGLIYNNEQYPFHLEGIRWSPNDVCGCGIEIHGDSIRINYWINGLFIGTAFEHKKPIISTTNTICNLLPNGNRTSFLPGVTLKVDNIAVLSSCEFIFHPMDMFECPLPNGYKPLLVPTLLDIDDLFVPYPYSAYLIGNKIEDNLIRKRDNISGQFLRDFIHYDHLETKFKLDNQQLILTEQSNGFPLVVNNAESWTISFDFSLLKIPTNTLEIPLLVFDSNSIRIPIKKFTNNNNHIAIIYQSNESKLEIFINNECKIVECSIGKNVHILPSMNVGIKNLAIWKYQLAKEHIQRLFTSGLNYVADDYQRLNEYKKRANMFIFNTKQNCFDNDSLVPFREPFDAIKWGKKKIEIDENESNYFNVDHGNIQLFGNKTYLVLDKPSEPWSEYTIILDISIHTLPLAIIKLNTQLEISITSNSQLCLLLGQEKNVQNQRKIKLNEYLRLAILVSNKSIKIYINGSLEINANVDHNQLAITDKHIDLFQESNSTINLTDENTLRIECKSITYLNKALGNIDEKLSSPNYSLESLINYPYEVISPSFIRIGYDESLIKLAMNQTATRDLYLIDKILHERKFNKYDETILSKLGFSIDEGKLKSLIQFSQYDNEEKLHNLVDIVLHHWNEINSSSLSSLSNDKNWFQNTVHHLNIDNNLSEWIRDKSTTREQTDLIYQLFDINQSNQKQSLTTNSADTIALNKIEHNHQNMTKEKYEKYRTDCEYSLISIYAHYTILNMLKVWSYDGSSLFPFEKFGDCTFIVKLLKLLDYHYKYKRSHTDEKIDRMSLLIDSILKTELNELLKDNNKIISYDILSSKAPLLYHLQKDILTQSIRIFINPLLLNSEYNNEYDVDKPSFYFIMKLVHLFLQLIVEKSTLKHDDVDFLAPLLFPEFLINILFNLFLLNSKHENRTMILRSFFTLLQTSNRFNLNKSIQQFFFQLFTELPPNSTSMNTQTMGIFQMALMDLVYLLTERQRNKTTTIDLTNELFKLPQNFHNLLLIIDFMKALTDRTKHTRFPELIIVQSIALLGENLQLTRDNIEQSNKYFDTTSDLQLVNFMNNNQLLELSFIEFIHSLPIDSKPNPSYYKTYPSLWHIPTIHIQIRAKLIYVFNLLIDKLVSFIDLSLLPGQSILIDKIQNIKPYIIYGTKSKLFNTTLTITTFETNNDMPTVNFNTVPESSNKHTMFQQAYEQLHANAHETFRKNNNQVWRAQYLSMHSTDQGGPFRDSVTQICSDVCSTRLSLFVLCPNGRTNSGLNDDRWIPNVYPPNEPIPNRIRKQYQFIGQLMGMAIRKKHYLNLKFPGLLWKQLVREQIIFEDIESIDMQSFSMINEMEKCLNQNDSPMEIEELLSSILDELRFEAVSANGQTYELVPNGKNIPITTSNVKDYCLRYREYRLNEFNRQIEYIRQGLYSVIPGYFLSLFTGNELEEMVCGKGEMDILLLKRNTIYGGHFSPTSPCIQQFWTILSEMFNEEQKKLFLKFVWGRCTLPNCDEDFGTSFRIEPYVLSAELIDGALPRAHTCTFVLDLPEYSNINIMYDRLNYAITYCTCIDGDGNMNEAPTPTNLDSDSATDD